jgi:hypothetical protein
MTNASIDNFKKRNPRRPPVEEPAQKRSHHIALLLMGTMAVGGSAYALMPHEKCDTTQPMTSEERLQCVQRNGSSSSSSGHSYSGSGSSWGSSGSSSSSGRSNFASSASSSSSGLSAASSSSSHVARSGFGSFGAHFSGGG